MEGDLFWAPYIHKYLDLVKKMIEEGNISSNKKQSPAKKLEQIQIKNPDTVCIPTKYKIRNTVNSLLTKKSGVDSNNNSNENESTRNNEEQSKRNLCPEIVH